MKKLTVSLIASSLMFSTLSVANDTGLAGIQVDRIESSAKPNGEKPVLTFQGAEAQKLMKVLPGVLVASAKAEQHANASKALSIRGKNSRGEVAEITLWCDNAEVSYDSRTGAEIFTPKTPECRISYNTGDWVTESDTVEFNPFAIAKKILGIR